jgi:CheY-like chemotaxis protein
MHVLLAEDNAINQQVAQEILEQAGLKVDIAVNGREAVDKARTGNYAAVLMDIQMPVMDGLEAAQTLRGIPGMERLPIIAMTAHALAGDRERSLAAGMNGHVTKPVDPAELFSELLRYAPETPMADASEPSMEAAPAAETPLDIPGLDAKTALARLGGNAKLLRRLLSDFARDYTDAAEDMHSLLDDGKYDEAARLAHTVKGVAANLGVSHVQATATALDAVFKAGGVPGEEDLDQFAQTLKEAVASIRSQDPAPTIPPAFPGSAQSLDPAVVLDALDRLEPLLRSSSMDADVPTERVVELLRGGAHAALAEELDRAVGSFDFDMALAVTKRIRGALSTEET